MNETLAECPFEARLLFIGLWTLADREGRLEDRPKRIKAELFPFDSFDVDPMLRRLQGEGFLSRYEVDGKLFIQIENFVKHQDPHYKEKASQIPPPSGRENLILASGVTRTQRARIYERDGYKCVLCAATDALCVDHILPVSRGGDSADDNLQTLCMSCNTKKGNKLDGESKNTRQRRLNVGSILPEENDASPSDSGFLIPDSGFLIPSSSVPNGTDVANAPAVAKSKSPEEQSKSDLWRSAVVVLQAGGCQDEATCRTFMGKLVRDYTFPVVQKAVEGAVSAQPVEAREYLKAACQRLKGERADPITVPSAAVDQTAALLAEQAAAAERARSPEAQAARQAVMARLKGVAA